MGLNPFRAGQCLSTNDNRSLLTKIAESQSLSSRAMSFDIHSSTYFELLETSQSLSIRAMSFDRTTSGRTTESNVSIPFDQGNVFRPDEAYEVHGCKYKSQSLSSRAMSFDNNSWARWICHTVSIPFDQGDVFRRSGLG